MASTYYCDQSGTYAAYSAIPAWGVAQDGDGTLATKAVPALASILINGVAVAGNVIVIMGVTLTAVASGATTGQFNVGATISIQADNIAAAINAATGLVSASASNTTHQLRNMVYARSPSSGAAANTVEIMTRYGSNKANYAVNANVAIAANVWSVAPTITQFSGSIGGAFGYFFNGDATIWPSGVAKNSYGCGFSGVGAGPLAGRLTTTIKDKIVLRSNNTVVTVSSTSGAIIQLSTSATFVIDDGTYWPGDTGYFKVLLPVNNAAQCAISCNATLNTKIKITSLNQARFIIENPSTGNNPFSIGGQGGTGQPCTFIMDNVTLNDFSASGTIKWSATYASYGGYDGMLSRFKLTVTANKWYSFFTNTNSAYLQNSENVLRSFVLDFSNYTGTPATGIFDAAAFLSNSSYGGSVVIEDGLVKTGGTKPFLMTASLTPTATLPGNKLIARNIQGVQPANTIGLLGSNTNQSGVSDKSFVIQEGVGVSAAINRYQKIETESIMVEMNPNANYPYLDSQLPSGASWAYRFDWVGSALAYCMRAKGIIVKLFSTTVTTIGCSVATLELLLPSSMDGLLDNDMLRLSCSYTRSDTGELASIVNASVITASAAAWTLLGYTGYTAYKLQVALPYPPTIGQDIQSMLLVHAENPKTDGTVGIVFINPDIGLS